MSKPVITIKPDDSILQAAKMMAEHKIGSLVVSVDKGKWGMITERDFVANINDGQVDIGKIKVSQAMSTSVITISPETLIEEAAKVMQDRGIRRLPVEADGELVGIVTQTSLILAMRKHVIGRMKNQMDEMDRQNKLMVGRELKMSELKREIERLNKEG